MQRSLLPRLSSNRAHENRAGHGAFAHWISLRAEFEEQGCGSMIPNMLSNGSRGKTCTSGKILCSTLLKRIFIIK